MATLRAHTAASMAALAEHCERLARGLAAAHGLGCEVSWTDDFPATENDPRVVRVVAEAARGLGLEVRRAAAPFAWSEDFGHFTARLPAALFGLGAGAEQPPLHHPSYDFPDALLCLLMSGWARIHGMVMLELFEHLGPVVGDSAAFFRYEIDAFVCHLGMARPPAAAGWPAAPF